MRKPVYLIAPIVLGCLSSPFATAETNSVINFLQLHGGCSWSMGLYNNSEQAARDVRLGIGKAVKLFGKELADWTDQDLNSVRRMLGECMATADKYRLTEYEKSLGWINSAVALARARQEEERQRQRAALDQKRYEAQQDKAAAERVRREAEELKPKYEEAQKEADDARQERDAAERALKEVKDRIAAQRANARKDAGEKAVAEWEKKIVETGYLPISVDNFLLDGRDLSSAGTKVSLSGEYVREGNLDVIYADRRSRLLAGEGNNIPKVLILVENASREFRQTLLQCQSMPYRSSYSCPVHILGRATSCEVSNAFGSSRKQPCIAVGD